MNAWNRAFRGFTIRKKNTISVLKICQIASSIFQITLKCSASILCNTIYFNSAQAIHLLMMGSALKAALLEMLMGSVKLSAIKAHLENMNIKKVAI